MDNPPEDGLCEVTITAPDPKWLQQFVRQLVEDRLAAAGHVDKMRTTYRWAGRVQEADEARARLHTTFRSLETIVSRARERHPYVVPCVVATKIERGEPQYLEWITESTSPAQL